ncbi:MAG: MotA/TolQ/ExbB proton channel family protein [Armatimonadetes bacterium]|nr:MotA/TolQ/ExbB proton channel family protein [Armatimonadota bacterium]
MFLYPIIACVALTILVTVFAIGGLVAAGRWLRRQTLELQARAMQLSKGEDPFPELTGLTSGSATSAALSAFSFAVATGDRAEPAILAIARRLKERYSSGDVSVTTSELMDPLDLETERRSLFARRAYGIVVFLGLLGTVLGLQAALADMGLMGDLKESKELISFVNRSKDVLQHFGLAFFATAGGVIGTIAIGASEYFFAKRRELTILNFTYFVDTEMRPFIRARFAPANGASASAAIITVLESMASALPAAAKELTELTHQAALAASVSSEAANKSLSAASVLDSGFSSIEDLPLALTNHLSAVQSASHQLVTTLDKVSRGSESLLVQLSDTVMRQTKLLEDTSHFFKESSKLSKQEVERAQVLTGSIASTKTVLESIHKELVTTKSTIPSVTDLVQGISGLLPKSNSDSATLELTQALKDVQLALRNADRPTTSLEPSRSSINHAAPVPEMSELTSACKRLEVEIQSLRTAIQTVATLPTVCTARSPADLSPADGELANIHRVLFDIRTILQRSSEKRPWWQVGGRKDA